ncbi:MAG: glycosyltransferase family 4 protein [Flavobacteriales bacterium]|jgi:glycosyltransferase involved in cell wall biosynthesis|nr:glycosyltransferase family 4 protein [Flavobacteriales bacterium]
MARLHIFAPHRPGRSPSQRYRLEQYLSAVEARGQAVVYAALWDEADDRSLYRHGHLLGKAWILAKGLVRRWRQVRRVGPEDTVLVHREAFMVRGHFFEKALRRRAKWFVFDMDDAIWRMDVSEANRNLRWLKDPAKTDRIIALADRVIAGNAYLADHARAINPATVVVPTVIDTRRYRAVPSNGTDRVTIGWTGSRTSTVHLVAALPMLRKVQERHGARVAFRVISDIAPPLPGLDVEHVPWNADTETRDLEPIDIGIMPMPDDEWSRGKCGFKGLQYMAMGKPVVLSHVGVNAAIVHPGVNGFLARTEADWAEALGRLVEDADLRRRMGAEARRTVEQQWSLHAWTDTFLRQLTPHNHTDQHDRPEEDPPGPRA